MVQHEGDATPIVGRHSVATVGSRSGSGAGMRPPRSPLKQPKKACVPTLEDALDDVQVRKGGKVLLPILIVVLVGRDSLLLTSFLLVEQLQT